MKWILEIGKLKIEFRLLWKQGRSIFRTMCRNLYLKVEFKGQSALSKRSPVLMIWKQFWIQIENPGSKYDKNKYFSWLRGSEYSRSKLTTALLIPFCLHGYKFACNSSDCVYKILRLDMHITFCVILDEMSRCIETRCERKLMLYPKTSTFSRHIDFIEYFGNEQDKRKFSEEKESSRYIFCPDNKSSLCVRTMRF